MARARLLVPFLLLAIVPACGGGNSDPDAGSGGNPDAGGNLDASVDDAGSADAGGTDAGGPDAGQPPTFSAIAPTSGYYPAVSARPLPAPTSTARPPSRSAETTARSSR